MSITVITNTTYNTEWYSKTTIPIIQKYCDKYKYDFIHYREHESFKHITWVKIPLILKTMDSTDNEWIFWEDADSCPLDHTIRLESYIENENADIIIDTQPAWIHIVNNMAYSAAENTGLWFIRNTQWSRDFLNDLYTNPKYFVWNYVPYHEQSAFSVARANLPINQDNIKLLSPYTMYDRLSYTKHFIHAFGDLKPLLLVAEKFVRG